jgi:hypothetical protein
MSTTIASPSIATRDRVRAGSLVQGLRSPTGRQFAEREVRMSTEALRRQLRTEPLNWLQASRSFDCIEIVILDGLPHFVVKLS